MGQYSYGFLIGLAMGASMATTIALLHARRFMRGVMNNLMDLRESTVRTTHALYCLATRERGFVDISPEEWNEPEQLNVQVIKMEDRVRVLAK